jgi:hypothetical protein
MNSWLKKIKRFKQAIMNRIQKIFHLLGDLVALIFGKLPKGWEQTTEDIIDGLNIAKIFLDSPGAASLAALFPKGVGTATKEALLSAINKALPMLEIAQGAMEIVEGVDDPEQRAVALIQYIITTIGTKQEGWRGKHWLDVARAILTELLDVTDTEANALINTKLGQMKAAKHGG